MDEGKAINDAYNTGIQCLFNVLFDGHLIEQAEEAEKRFAKGVEILRKVRKTALRILEETDE